MWIFSFGHIKKKVPLLQEIMMRHYLMKHDDIIQISFVLELMHQTIGKSTVLIVKMTKTT